MREEHVDTTRPLPPQAPQAGVDRGPHRGAREIAAAVADLGVHLGVDGEQCRVRSVGSSQSFAEQLLGPARVERRVARGGVKARDAEAVQGVEEVCD